MNRTFRILCEVKFLHEFYLTEGDGNTIFDLPDQQARMDFLQRRLLDNAPAIGDDLGFELLSSDQDIFSGYRLKLLPSYSGFQIAISVEERELAGNITGYAPTISLPNDLAIRVLIIKKNNHIDQISNDGLSSTLPGKYLFTNLSVPAIKTMPFLSSPVAARVPLFSYEQGELALDNTDNTIKAFFSDNSGVEQWAPVKGEGYTTRGDRIVLPPKFYYDLSKFPGATNINFTLSDNNGTVLQSLQHDIKASDKNLFLDFNQQSLSMIDVDRLRGESLYSLKVEGNNGLSTTHKIVFASEYLPADCWGVVVLQPEVPQSEFSLIDQDGLVLTRKDPAGDVMPPVFEVRLKSRFAFWRYRNNKNKKIKANTSLDPFLEFNGPRGIRDSISFRNATYLPTTFSDGANTLLLPNPPSFDSLVQENNRVYVEIPVPRSDLFDI